VFVTVFDQQLMSISVAIASELRHSGIPTLCYPEAGKLPRQFKAADRSGARFVIVVGPDEAGAGQVTLKDLVNHTQETVDRGELLEKIKKMLA